MEEKPQEERPTQQTDKGLTILVPTRDEIEDALAEIAKPQKAKYTLWSSAVLELVFDEES
jgi:hypothetical protein